MGESASRVLPTRSVPYEQATLRIVALKQV